MFRTTVAGECLLNIDHHIAAWGPNWYEWLCIDQHTAKLNMYHNSATHSQAGLWLFQQKQEEIGVVAGRKNNRRGRLLNTLMNSLKEVINVTFARKQTFVSLRINQQQPIPPTHNQSHTISEHTNIWLMITEWANVVLREYLRIAFASRKLKTHYNGLGSASIIPFWIWRFAYVYHR